MAPSTTVVPTTAPHVTIPVDSPEQLRMNIEWDLNVGENALMVAGTDPSNSALRADLARYFADAPLATLTEFLDGIVRDGLLVRSSHEVPNAVRVLRVEHASDPLAQAVVVACRLDAAVVYEPIGQTEAIVNDAIQISLTTNTMGLIDGIWQLVASDGIDHPDIRASAVGTDTPFAPDRARRIDSTPQCRDDVAQCRRGSAPGERGTAWRWHGRR